METERERETRARGRWTDEVVTQEWDMKRKDSALGIILLLLHLSPLSFSLWTGKVAWDRHGSHHELCPFSTSLHPSSLLSLPCPTSFFPLSSLWFLLFVSSCRRVQRVCHSYLVSSSRHQAVKITVGTGTQTFSLQNLRRWRYNTKVK